MIVYASCISCGKGLQFEEIDPNYDALKALQLQYLGELNIMAMCEKCNDESTDRCSCNPG
jgi:hypothetical protein